MTESIGALVPWQNFYVIVGSAGGALIGLQFVVVALIANVHHSATASALSAFGTPTVVNLAGALLLSAIMCAPWPSLVNVSVALAMCCVGGLAYGVYVIRHSLLQTVYQPDWDDWLWYAVLPCCIYAALAPAAVLLRANPQSALFVVGAAALSLLFIGIRNAWDTVTHIVVSHGDATEAADGTVPRKCDIQRPVAEE